MVNYRNVEAHRRFLSGMEKLAIRVGASEAVKIRYQIG
jgi:hypothetical protein